VSQVVIIKYNAGNIRSVLFALERIGVEAVVTDDPELIRKASRVIFPGVGEASSAMKFLREKGLDTLIPSLTQPVLGICLGMQLMCAHSEENNTECLGIFPMTVRKFPDNKGLKVPQIGWNTIDELSSALFEGVSKNTYVYFVHGYYIPENEFSIAKATYTHPYCAAVRKDNFMAVQFHPEKSGDAGEQMLRNFLLAKI
jgi:glutamine amidotransferase